MDDGADVERMLADLARWAADERADETARGRSRERWLVQQATEDARLVGVAVDLAEQRRAVSVRTTGGRTVRGVIAAVATDFWVLESDGVATLVAAGAVTTVRPLPGSDDAGGGEGATGERRAVLDMRLVDALSALAGDRPRVRLALHGEGEVVTGELRAAGADVLTVRPDGTGQAPVYVAVSGVMECSILGSG